MVEPFAALSLACAVIQFIDFGTKLVREGSNRYHSLTGATDEDIHLENVVENLKTLTDPLRYTRRDRVLSQTEPCSAADKRLLEIARTCEKTSDELMDILRSLRKSDDTKYPKLDATRMTFQRMRQDKRIKTLGDRLEKHRRDLHTQYLSRLSQSSSDISHAINTLLEASRDLSENVSENLKQNAEALERSKSEILNALDDLRTTKNDAIISIDLTMISKAMAKLAEAGPRVTRQHSILRSLYFPGIGIRQGKTVADAEEDTFEWAWDKNTDEIQLNSWLESGDGIFWISGKPGSGKSTFIKHVCHDSRTHNALESWGGSRKAVPIEFYFWNDGTLEQKSQRGLLRSLLFQVLRQIPEVIPTVCVERWVHDSDVIDRVSQNWTLDELTASFRNLSELSSLPMRFCFFVDGLDEFDPSVGDGEHNEMLDFLKSAAACPDIKLCLATRPWTFALDDLDNSSHRIFMENMTKGCIEKYTKRKLNGNKKFRRLKDKEAGLSNIATMIVRKSEGVFLWVFLVVKRLLKGVENSDSVTELLEKVHSMPPELNEFFRRSIDEVEPDYQSQSAQVLQIAREALQPLSIYAYRCLDEERQDADYAVHAAVEPFDGDDLDELYKSMRLRLQARAIDLLEVNEIESGTSFLRYRVNFIHRTVRDYLRDSKDIVALLESRSPKDFHPKVSLSRASVAQLKALPITKLSEQLNDTISLVDEMSYHAWQLGLRDLDRYKEVFTTDIFDELDQVMTIRSLKDMNIHWTNARDVPKGLYEEGRQSTFLAYTIQVNLKEYVRVKLNQPNIMKAKKGRPYLDYALRPVFVTPTPWPIRDHRVDIEMVDMLLKNGADPNQAIHLFDGQTPWSLFLVSCQELNNSLPPRTRKDAEFIQAKTIERLLHYGADPRRKCSVWLEDRVQQKQPDEMMAHIFRAGEAWRLQNLIKEKQRQSWGFLHWFWKLWSFWSLWGFWGLWS